MAKSEFRRVFGTPVLLGFVAAVGLVSALLSDGWGDVISWFGLGVLVAVPALRVARQAWYKRGVR